jgi:hypothetical protein
LFRLKGFSQFTLADSAYPFLTFTFTGDYNESLMGLKGNLSTVNLADVFQVLSRGNSTGLLRIQAPEGPRFVEIQNGAISIAGRSAGRIMLGDLLISRGLLDEEQLNQGLKIQRETSKMLGQVLLEMGMVSMEHLEEALRFQVEEEVCELFTLGKGDFDFLAGALLDAKIAPGGGLVRMQIDPNSLLLEAARRADEWKAIEKRIPSQSFLFKLTAEGSKILSSGEGLSPEGLVILRLAQDSRTIEAMVQKACLGRLNTNQMLVELWDAGLVEPLPISEYDKAARSHLKLNRVEEAERIANFAVERGDKDEKAKAESTLKEISAARKSPQSQTNVSVTADPKVRSEVIRRNAPGLILKKERSWIPYAVVVGIVVLAVGGYFGYTLFGGRQAVNEVERKRFATVVEAAEAKVHNKQYSGALDELRIFHSSDPETEKLGRDKYEKLSGEVEGNLRLAIRGFNDAMAKGSAQERDAAATELKLFINIGTVSAAVDEDFKKALAAVQTYEGKRRLDADKAHLKELISGAKAKDCATQQQDLDSFLKSDPPEEVAADARDKLRELLKQRAEADRRLKQAEMLRAVGDTDGAKIVLGDIKRDGPGTDYVAKADAGIKELDKYFEDENARLDKIDILLKQKQIDDAKAELTKFLDERPPQRLMAARALPSFQEISPDPGDLAAQIAGLKGQRNTPEGRKKLADILQKAPYSKTAAQEKFEVNVTSEPAGADVVFNGRLVGKTPCTVEAPAVGMSRFLIKKTGFDSEEILDYNCRRESVSVTLSRLPALAKRLPTPARGGLAASSDQVVAVTPKEIEFCGTDLKIAHRVPMPETATEEFNSVVLVSGYALIAHTGKSLGVVVASSTSTPEYSSLPIMDQASAPPWVYKSKQVTDKRVLVVPTAQGVDWEILEDGKPLRPADVFTEAGKQKASGIVSIDEMVAIAHGDALVGVIGHAGTRKWEISAEAAIVGPPVCNTAKNLIAVISANNRLLAVDAEKGIKRFQRDLSATPHPGLLSTGTGLVVALKNGKAELYPFDQGTALWSSNLPGDVIMPGVAIRATERDAEKAVAFCTHDKDSYYITLLNVGNGQATWRTTLSSKPLAIAAGNDKLYVVTEDGDLLAYDAN